MDYREGMQVLRAARLFAPALIQLNGYYHVCSRTKVVSSGASIYEALEAGGFLVPQNAPRFVFTAYDRDVLLGADKQAVAKSSIMAQRIANALNEYVPGKRRV